MWTGLIETSVFKKKPTFLTILNNLVDKCLENVFESNSKELK